MSTSTEIENVERTTPAPPRRWTLELVVAAVVLASFIAFGLTARAFVSGFVGAVLVTLAAIDIEQRILPNRIVLPAAAVTLAAQVTLFPERAGEWVFASLGTCLFLLVLLVIYPGGIGMGDVKLGLLLGAALGTSVVPAVVLGFIAASLYALFLLARHGAAARKMTMPFGPFLASGALVTLFSSSSWLI